jgi:hypothetical protein
MSTPLLVQAPISICFSEAALHRKIDSLEMPIYPKHDRDEKEWNTYMTAREKK